MVFIVVIFDSKEGIPENAYKNVEDEFIYGNCGVGESRLPYLLSMV